MLEVAADDAAVAPAAPARPTPHPQVQAPAVLPMHPIRPLGAAPSPAPKASGTVKKGCDPNYTIDPLTGRKKYKLECM